MVEREMTWENELAVSDDRGPLGPSTYPCMHRPVVRHKLQSGLCPSLQGVTLTGPLSCTCPFAHVRASVFQALIVQRNGLPCRDDHVNDHVNPNQSITRVRVVGFGCRSLPHAAMSMSMVARLLILDIHSRDLDLTIRAGRLSTL